MQWLARLRARIGFDSLPVGARKLIVGVIGGTLLVIGLVMIVLPGSALLVIPAGLVVLASEFAWARHLIRRGRELISRRRSSNSGAARTTTDVSR